MKLSLRWVCDHLSVSWDTISVEKLVEYFNIHVAEIEVFTPVALPLERLFIGTLEKKHSETCTVTIAELAQTVELPLRDDAHNNHQYLLIKEGATFRWAHHIDLAGTKENLLPAVTIDEKLRAGAWKKQIEIDDIILEVDNKSITHRPDLWSHRGFAREVAPFLKANLKDAHALLVHVPEKTADSSFKATADIPVSVAVETPACSRFAVLALPQVKNKPTSLAMAVRLARVDSRVINGVVDATNYVMLDWGQPLHAFDAHAVTTATLIPRQAKAAETLTLLNGTVLELVQDDMVITDGKKPLALAGVKGGLDSGVSDTTTSLLVESATFAPGVVRMGAARHGLRTEASARFEKSLDPSQNVAGIERFLKILDQEHIVYTHAPAIVSLGALSKPTVITIQQSFIEDRLGISFKKDQIKHMLEQIGFSVEQKHSDYGTELQVTVPTFRATKDVKIPEDIVEEVGRLYGYSALQSTLPVFAKQPTDDQWLDRMFTIKKLLTHAAHMHEVATYSFADNEFAQRIGWNIKNPLTLRNPIAEHRTTMLDDLIPALLQVVEQNKADHEQLKLFEWARVWSNKQGKAHEEQVLSGLFYQRKDVIDFYQVKSVLNLIAQEMGCIFTYKHAQHPAWWANEHVAAEVYLDDVLVGSIAAVSAVTMARIDGGSAVAFVLDGHTLAHYKKPSERYAPLSKFQGTFLDTSALFDQHVAVTTIEHALKKIDTRIVDVVLWDMFSKPEWHGKRSLTFRCFVQDATKNMTKQDTEALMQQMVHAVEKVGGEVR